MVLTRQNYKELGIPLAQAQAVEPPAPKKKQAKIPYYFKPKAEEVKRNKNIESLHPHEWSVDRISFRRGMEAEGGGGKGVDLATELAQATTESTALEARPEQEPQLGDPETKSEESTHQPMLRGKGGSPAPTEVEEWLNDTRARHPDLGSYNYIMTGLYKDLLEEHQTQLIKELGPIKNFLSECLGLLTSLIELIRRKEDCHFHKEAINKPNGNKTQSNTKERKTSRAKLAQGKVLATRKPSLKGKSPMHKKKPKNVKMGRKAKLPSRTGKVNFSKLFKILENSSTKNPNKTTPNKSQSPNILNIHQVASPPRLAKQSLPSSGKLKETPDPKQETPQKGVQKSQNLILIKHKLVLLPLFKHGGLSTLAQQRIYLLKKIDLVIRGLIPAGNIVSVKFLPFDMAQNRVVVTFKDWSVTKQIMDKRDRLQRAGLLVTRLFEESGVPPSLLGTRKPTSLRTELEMASENCKQGQPEAVKISKQKAKLQKTLLPSNEPKKDILNEKEMLFLASLEQIQQSQDALIARLQTIKKSLLRQGFSAPLEFNFATNTTKPLSNEDWTQCRFLSPEEVGSPTQPLTPQTTTHQVDLAMPMSRNGSIFVDASGSLDGIQVED
ncbi:Hypothetical predicted protein [Podarcis lilfordi]|uniref:Uncharacterized protein n=1 Tax=Podarcis lilfordi TaxID=74358 RepID=A0AA35K5Q9_9SAUR|nr:Hypothetical predicted protein [Podarcis lilfordi]